MSDSPSIFSFLIVSLNLQNTYLKALDVRAPVRSAVDLVVHMEREMAEKDGRATQILSRVMNNEVSRGNHAPSNPELLYWTV